jgi:hypothetical protein
MEDGAKLRRGELIEEIKRLRQQSYVLEFVERNAPSLMREEAATHRLEVTEKLHLLENALHALNVQLIRQGLPANPRSTVQLMSEIEI